MAQLTTLAQQTLMFQYHSCNEFYHKNLLQTQMQGETLNMMNSQSQQIAIPVCKYQNNASQACQNPICKSYIFICANESCECQKEHQLCIKVGLKALIKIVSKKRLKSNNQLSEYIERLTDEMIDEISRLRDNILSRLDNLGLSEYERTFLTLMEKKDYKQISSATIHEICSNLHVKQDINLQNSLQFVQSSWQNDKKKFDQLLESLSKNFSKSLHSVPISKGIYSKIVSANEWRDLMEMFNQKIVKINLLYRASEHNFSVPQFRKLCDKKKNNLCIVKTQHGNIIGAFTPIPWDTSVNSQYVNDPSCKTFIFSLTLKKKFIQTNGGNQATHHYTNWGPRLGVDGTCDFAIGENSNNTNSSCYANIGNLFTPKYPEDLKNIESIKQNFIGGGIKGSSKFKITEWEMFELTF